MNNQVLTALPSRVRICTTNHQERIEVTYRKVTPKQQIVLATLPIKQKHLLKKHLHRLHLWSILELQDWYNKQKQGLTAFKLDFESYEEFKKRKLREANEQI
ncbi:MAG TPA: hypothetical protein DCS93_00720 [Microscillaceae bacterium]|nr:hypothetical protein [Microscillaceae bacterium]